MSNASSSYKNIKGEKDMISPNKYKNETRANRLKQIDAIYKSQIEQIYSHGQSPKAGIQATLFKRQEDKDNDKEEKTSFSRKAIQLKSKPMKMGPTKFDDIQNMSTSSRVLHSVVSQQKIKSLKYISGDSSKALDLLKLQNQNKETKIRDLTNKCEYLLQKLRNHLSANQFSQEVQALSKMADNKIQRFENLFKIKNQETFFKIKLQIMSLLQEFDVPKQQLSSINDIQTQSSLFSFLSKKIKSQLKVFKNRDQQNNFQIQKDKILGQKYEERITFLTQTSQLLKISEQKLKQKNESLKSQLHEFLQKLKQKQLQLQQIQSQLFRQKRQNQELVSNNSRTFQIQKRFKQQQETMGQKFQIKEKQYKILINNQNIQKKRLQSEVDEKNSVIEQIIIKEKYLNQQNERINRQLLRTRQRYEWCEKQLQNVMKQFQDEKAHMMDQYRKYKQGNNQSMILAAKSQTQQAMHKIQQYQQAYARIIMSLEQEKKTSQLKYQQYLHKLQAVEQSWLEKTKRIQQIKEEQLEDISKQYEDKNQQIRKEFQKKQKLVAEEMQAKMKVLLAEKDRKNTEKLIEVQQQIEELKKQLDQQKQLNSILQTKK